MTADSGDELRQTISGHIREYLASNDERVEWVRKAVRKHDFLPVYLGWIAALGIRPDGSVLRWNHGDKPTNAHEVPPAPETDPYWNRMTLAAAATSYPDLAELVPTRPDHAVTCGTCGGSGDFPQVESKKTALICQCGGLGWLLAGEPTGNSPG